MESETDSEKAKNWINKLKANIRKWDNAYYSGNEESTVHDSVYDSDKLLLKTLEAKYPEHADPASPTKRVGQVTDDTYKNRVLVKHKVPMLSLNTQTDTSKQPIVDFLKRVSSKGNVTNIMIVTEPKYDGVSLDLQYDHGPLKHAVLRGDGLMGEDVIRHFKAFEKIPTVLEDQYVCSVRGEVVLTKVSLATINSARVLEGKTPYANARNAVAGMLNMLETTALHQLLDFYAYDLIYNEGAPNRQPVSHILNLRRLQRMGFTVMFNGTLRGLASESDLADDIHELYIKYRDKRADIPFDIDGVVYKVDGLELREKLGFTATEPNWAIAHKFVPEAATTKVLDIITSVGRSGDITPIAILEPVFVGGVTVSRVNLYGTGYLRELDLSVGDTVVVHRAGDTVPELVSVAARVEPGKRTDIDALLSRCPACQTPLTRNDCCVIEELTTQECPNTKDCIGQIKARLNHAVSRPILNIRGMGVKTVAALCEKGYLRDVPDLFLLTREKLQDIGMSPIATAKMLTNINNAKKLGLEYFIAAIFGGFGVQRAKLVVKHYPTLHKLRYATKANLSKIKGLDCSLAGWMVDQLKDIYYFNKLSFVLGRADPASTFASEQIPSLFVVGYF